jgi:hypothetical protein
MTGGTARISARCTCEFTDDLERCEYFPTFRDLETQPYV